MDCETLLSKMLFMSKGAPVFSFPVFKEWWKRLITVILSTRTSDTITFKASQRLFSRAKTLEALRSMSEEEIAKLIYPVGFYKTKARYIKAVASLRKEPKSLDELLSIPGVGRKVAKVFLALRGQPVIGVDVHVHRVANRLGLVNTRSPAETEQMLERLCPPHLRRHVNKVFVAFGQTICKHRPHCERCLLKQHCHYYLKSVRN